MREAELIAIWAWLANFRAIHATSNRRRFAGQCLASGRPTCDAAPMHALLLRLTPLLPPPLRVHATPARIATLVQFMKFGVVGVIGFLTDTAVVYGLRASLGLYGAGAVAYIVAASGNWLLNRIWTFRGRG